MKLCESRIIHKNPKYRIIQYNEKYYLVDLSSTWLSFVFPMINWFIPKKCAEISKEEVEQLNIVKPTKNNATSWAAGGAICIGVALRKYITLFDMQLDKILALIICSLMFICAFVFLLHLNKKLSLSIYTNNLVNSKIILLPTPKNILFTFFAYTFLGGFSIMIFHALTFGNLFNIVIFLIWGMIVTFFLFSNMFSIIDTKVRAKLITKELKK
ncbi:DUF443 family protein [Mammaliicoccus stepanovicii]|nr:DUF443 family protein [Mammaliicoccus stepanovicii]GGI41403.1 hypothetical protein GCM10010896_13180 [Mammaliicoccus stepanovicii]